MNAFAGQAAVYQAPNGQYVAQVPAIQPYIQKGYSSEETEAYAPAVYYTQEVPHTQAAPVVITSTPCTSSTAQAVMTYYPVITSYAAPSVSTAAPSYAPSVPTYAAPVYVAPVVSTTTECEETTQAPTVPSYSPSVPYVPAPVVPSYVAPTEAAPSYAPTPVVPAYVAPTEAAPSYAPPQPTPPCTEEVAPIATPTPPCTEEVAPIATPTPPCTEEVAPIATPTPDEYATAPIDFYETAAPESTESSVPVYASSAASNAFSASIMALIAAAFF